MNQLITTFDERRLYQRVRMFYMKILVIQDFAVVLSLKYITIQSTWPGNKYSMSRVDPSRNL
jgi:hypothetical protein